MPDTVNIFKLDIEETIHKAAPSMIFLSTRRRKHFDKTAQDELTESMRSAGGQSTPGLCFLNDSSVPQLIFGERRLRSCEALGLEFRYQLTSTQLSAYQLAVLEIDENIRRADFTWREKADTKAELHRLSQAEFGAARPGAHGGHGIKETAAILNESAGNVSEDLQLSEYAAAVPEVAKAKTRTEALKIIARLKTDTVRDMQLERARRTVALTEGDSVVIDPAGMPTSSALFDQRLASYDQICIHGKLEDHITALPPQHVVCFDPPWGVGFDTVALVSPTQKTYKDDFEFVQAKLPIWLRLVYAAMAEDSHLYLFFGIVHHGWAYDLLDATGFTTNRMPLFWYKPGSHRTRSPKRWPGRSYEAIAFAHKGHRDLYRQGAPDILPIPAPTPAMKQSHPSAKHPALYLDLLERSCQPGDNVLDPMSGSGMFGVAVEHLASKLALKPTLIEQDEEHRNLGVFNMARGYASLTGDTGPVIDDLPEDFHKLTPGTDLWKRYWEANPEDHKEMLEWRLDAKKK